MYNNKFNYFNNSDNLFNLSNSSSIFIDLLKSSELSELSGFTEFTESIEFTESTESESTESSTYSISYYRRKKWSKTKTRTKIQTNSICQFKLSNYDIGYTSNLTKSTPFIEYLINKRINFCQLGASTHIAAFIPSQLIPDTVLYTMGNKKIIIGENSDNPLYSNSKIKTHAEMDALNRAKGLIRCKKMKKNKMDLIVLRINKLGELCESAPCLHCTRELAENNFIQINKLYYSRPNGTITCVKFDKWVNSGTCCVSKGWRWLQINNKNKL